MKTASYLNTGAVTSVTIHNGPAGEAWNLLNLNGTDMRTIMDQGQVRITPNPLPGDTRSDRYIPWPDFRGFGLQFIPSKHLSFHQNLYAPRLVKCEIKY